VRYLTDTDVFFAAMYGEHAHRSRARSWLDDEKPKDGPSTLKPGSPTRTT